MNPAFSVILFTTLSGAGYGLWFWTMVGLPFLRKDALGLAGLLLVPMLALGLVMVAIGLGSSIFHLGKPARAWRAFSQWRTSWLSREGVLSVTTFLPVAYIAGRIYGWLPTARMPDMIAAIWIVAGSVTTVLCTGMIYASLKPIPAWSHRLVLPVYLVFALHTGALIALAIAMPAFDLGNIGASLLVAVTSILAWRLKRRYWTDIDRLALPSREAATALEGIGKVTTFERPHTEANYLTREMGFVLARKHAAKLRLIATALFAGVPILCSLLLWLLPAAAQGPLLAIAAVSALLGAFVERWLFFAEAKHMVMLYY